MIGRKGDFCLAAGDFALQCLDTVTQFVNRQGIEILPDQLAQWIVAAQRKLFVHVRSFDVHALAVNGQAA